MMGPEGVLVDILREDADGCLLYIYRPLLLSARLEDEETGRFLESQGYGDLSVPGVISELKARFRTDRMPHEVGVFLDYPTEDVRGYMENSGRCSSTVGCWKVYGDAVAAEARFDLFRRCREVSMRRLAEGCGLARLADCASQQVRASMPSVG